MHLEVGEPDFDTPANIIEAGAEASDRAGPITVLPAGSRLQGCHSHILQHPRGTNYDLNNIVVTPGGKPIMFFGDPGAARGRRRSDLPRTPASRSTNR